MIEGYVRAAQRGAMPVMNDDVTEPWLDAAYDWFWKFWNREGRDAGTIQQIDIDGTSMARRLLDE